MSEAWEGVHFFCFLEARPWMRYLLFLSLIWNLGIQTTDLTSFFLRIKWDKEIIQITYKGRYMINAKWTIVRIIILLFLLLLQKSTPLHSLSDGNPPRLCSRFGNQTVSWNRSPRCSFVWLSIFGRGKDSTNLHMVRWWPSGTRQNGPKAKTLHSHSLSFVLCPC